MSTTTCTKCRRVSGVLCGVIGIGCIVAGLVINEITRANFEENINIGLELNDTDTESSMYSGSTICGWNAGFQCIFECDDKIITFYNIDNTLIESNTTVSFINYSDECTDDSKSIWCDQATSGYIWLSIMCLSIIITLISLILLCCHRTMNWTAPCYIIAAILSIISWLIFILMSTDNGMCWSEPNNFDGTFNLTLGFSTWISIAGSVTIFIAAALTCCIQQKYGDSDFQITY